MKSSPISKKQSSFSETPQAQRSLFASRAFDPEPEETEDAARGTHATVQQQPARSPAKPFNFLTVPLHPAPAAPANSIGAIQRQSATEVENTELEDAELQKTSIQAKLTIGQPNDKYEQEADRVASKVVNQINTPPPAPIQREENLEAEAAVQMPSVQREAMPEEEEELQMMPLQRVAGGAGMAASSDLEASIAQARGGGQPLAQSIREPIEQAMGADFSGVKVHTDAQSDRLNRSVQAKAFTTGQDVFFRQGEYNPGNRGGQELLAHELTHVVQQTGNTVLRTFPQQSRSSRQGKFDIIQRQFEPVTTTSNAHLRNEGGWETHVGNRINSGSEIVVDQEQQRTEARRFRNNRTWTKAVNVTGAQWNWGRDSERTTYIRDSSIGARKQYPARANNDYKPAGREYWPPSQLNWHPLAGEFVEIEDSVSTPGTKIAYHKGDYKRINPQTGDIVYPLDADEHRQINTAALEQHLKDNVRAILTNATNGMAWQNLLLTDRNICKVMMAEDGGSKALRWDDLGKAQSGEHFIAYYQWVTNPNGPFDRIREGAEYARNSLEHWRKSLFPPKGTNVTITSLSLSGSDLHESGLGVMFVTFNKAIEGRNADYYDAGDYEVVVKPEERVLEQKLFGTQDASLANIINTQVGLAGSDQITTYKQKIDTGFGTLCEKVIGTQAKNLPRDQIRPITQALKESLVFVLITGLADLNWENIIWDAQGKPYMIDADNALKLRYMTPNEATAQRGYIAYGANDDTLRDVYNSLVGYETRIMQALQNPQTQEQQMLLDRVKRIFGSSVGRTVPIETAVWGQRLRYNFILSRNDGLNTAVAIPGQQPATKWQWCDQFAATVPNGGGANAPGLVGEVGMRGGTDGNFQRNVEKAQLYADFRVGQIPFYNYQYGTGNVLHNGQIIWNGQPVTERMAGLFALFPNQVTT